MVETSNHPNGDSGGSDVGNEEEDGFKASRSGSTVGESEAEKP
jgi:hypothetical protein